MEASIIFHGILAALGYVLLQSLFIVGVRIAADDSTEILPNGRQKDRMGMILYPVLKYLSRTKQEKIYYEGSQFTSLIGQIRMVLADLDMIEGDSRLKIINRGQSLGIYVNKIEDALYRIDNRVKIEIEEGLLRFYRMDEQYRLNKYLRKPILQCPICMASVWSIPSYWIPVIYKFGFNMEILYLGAINVCVVACVNALIWVKFKSMQKSLF
ncbi:MAG: hypothetical protein H6Q14_2663 [Bacteroidetes bacterium]|nr:hypothetical protein [Bacteroidota bacterium]MBP1618836.1 hypothetical protein [Bacteroidota bacterium]